jgi:ferritin
MNKLREKFEHEINDATSGMYSINAISEQCEQINDDFTIKFLEWLNENSIYYPKDKQYFFNNEWHSQEETFKHFKNNIYEK